MPGPVHVRLQADNPDRYPDVESGAGRGIHVIANGWVVSAQAGWGSYCSSDPTRTHTPLTKSSVRVDCEVAYWSQESEEMVDLGRDTVDGWVPWGVVFDMVEWIRSLDGTPDPDVVAEQHRRLRQEYEEGS